MISKKIIIIFALGLVVLMVSGSVNAAVPFITQDAVIWELTKTTMIDAGKTVEMDEGVFTNGIVLEARAKPKSGRAAPEGVFRLKFDVFVPNRDLPMQKAGYWYVRGAWTVTRDGASSESRKARHSPDVIQGDINTVLQYDPLAGKGWTAQVSLPMSPAAGRWSRGQGTLTMNGQLEGDLFLDLKQWPELQGR